MSTPSVQPRKSNSWSGSRANVNAGASADAERMPRRRSKNAELFAPIDVGLAVGIEVVVGTGVFVDTRNAYSNSGSHVTPYQLFVQGPASIQFVAHSQLPAAPPVVL